jgi:putative restriction endonuclease
MDEQFEKEVRTAAINHVQRLSSVFADIIPGVELNKGFEYRGEIYHLKSQQGIFKPRQLDLPLTITTSYDGPYEDDIGDEFLTYKYRGYDQSYYDHCDNVGLRKLINTGLPLIYFHGVEKGKYVAVYPVYIVDDNPDRMEFTVAADDIRTIFETSFQDPAGESGRRQYVTREVKLRLHQSGFRARIMKAYNEQCAICRLKHPELLDAAHIIPDSEEGGTAEVQNGLSLCKIHHSAYDQNIIGIDTDYKVHVRRDILEEIDGPMLKHGIQELNQTRIYTPRGNQKPSLEKLDWRFQRFRSA